MDTQFDALRTERLTESGKACIDMARRALKGRRKGSESEARQWIKLALACDANPDSRRIRDLEKLVAKLMNEDGKAERLFGGGATAGGNVVPLRTGDGDAAP